MAGVVVGGCRLEGLLGRGGMGTVYRATQLALGREVAVKVVPASDVEPSLVARFKREARTAASLEHPHSLPIYAAGEEDGLLYLVMRLVHGADLGALVAREGALEPSRAVALIAQIAGALDAAHAAGLVHRDVKPANVLVENEDGERAYLSDFGLMRRMVGATAITRVDEWVGSVDYIAPEQVEGRPVDHRADIYSLTGVLYYALSGERPFPRENPTATAWAQVNSPRPRLSASPAMEAVIGRGMAVAPGDRFASARELAEAAWAALGGVAPPVLERTTAGVAEPPTEIHTRRRGPGVAPTPPARDQSPAPGRRRRGWLALLGLLLLAGGAAAAVVIATEARNHTKTVTTHPPTNPLPRTQHFTDQHYSFTYPSGWRLVQNEFPSPTGVYFRTEVVNPAGTESVLIDRTPHEPLSPEAKSVQVQQGTEHTPGGYVPINSQSITINGRDAFIWEFQLPSGQPPWPYKVDIFLHRGSTGFAILGTGAKLKTVEAITTSVAQSLTAQ